MPDYFQIKVDVPENLQTFLAGRQMPFVISRALNWTGANAQQEIRSGLGNKFTLRNHWVRSGVRIHPSTKSFLETTVYHADPYMTKHETGKPKLPPQGTHLAIPRAVKRRSKPCSFEASNSDRMLEADN